MDMLANPALFFSNPAAFTVLLVSVVTLLRQTPTFGKLSNWALRFCVLGVSFVLAVVGVLFGLIELSSVLGYALTAWAVATGSVKFLHDLVKKSSQTGLELDSSLLLTDKLLTDDLSAARGELEFMADEKRSL